jgi:sec-independent protein translocase protein TatC
MQQHDADDFLSSQTASTAEQPLAGHLDELRRRLGISLLAVGLGSALCTSRIDILIQWLKRPAGKLLPHLAFFSPAEALMAYLKVACLAGLALAMPVILYQAWAFVRAGLTPEERRWGGVFVGWGSLQFILGVAFAYGVLLPVSLRFLLGFAGAELEPVISVDRYLGFVVSLSFWCGVIFQLPVALVLLTRMGLLTPQWLAQQRPYALLGLVVLAALLTPTTDVVSLMLMVLPLFVLYEVAVWMSAFTGRRLLKKKNPA